MYSFQVIKETGLVKQVKERADNQAMFERYREQLREINTLREALAIKSISLEKAENKLNTQQAQLETLTDLIENLREFSYELKNASQVNSFKTKLRPIEKLVIKLKDTF